MGLHRDPAHFKSLSPFEGEMRRRVWATMFMMELSCSTQMGMPRIIKDSIVDTLEPRNLQDDDIYPEMVSLPPERPWTELTPALMVVAKSRMSKAFSVVSDLVTDPRPHSYKTVMEIDAMLGQTMDDIPPPCRHRPMSKSIMDSPKLITQVSDLRQFSVYF